MSKNLYLLSLGCNKNLIDSEIMLGRLKEYQLVDDPKSADVMIVNTCGFINSAKEESIEAILELSYCKKDSNTLLIVTGCLMERYKEELIKELPEVDLFSGVGDFNKIDELISKKESRFSPKVYLQKDESRVITGSNYHAYVKISEGCNQKCSFCAIPNFKGKLQSRSIKEIVGEVESLVKMGYYDFSFISQDSSSYGRDLGLKEGLIELIDAVEKIEGVKFARILYLYPTTTSRALLEKIISSKIFLNYFDMPIQHINNDMLRIMKRGAKKEQILELLKMMREAKDSFLRTAFIVGHPGEDESRFDELVCFLNEFKFDRVSVFAYSKEEGTPSFDMPEVDEKIVEERVKKLEKLTKKILDESFKSDVGREFVCQIDGYSSEGELFFGAKKSIWDIKIDGEILINDSAVKDISIGKSYLCKITKALGNGQLLGEIIDRA
ncbi:30S ribosomal protein S12 methylthiotransferase RimO [uncultured Campylobacter sp.]|uniref:30S ribosomal protein S12 methylthiotransferase RimO n=1 Tax=uncultured Campylobacter sp. TaxID=218934 RepID=UPI00262318F0|nr:30S ribosomal protein S12 methylthiotransferase RimO [uncultured Campylobacter sp.]